jgi:hypothetical protein
MLLMGYSPEGNMLWEKLVDGGYYIDYTNMFYTGSNSFLAIGTASPDSTRTTGAELLLVRFNKTGQITTEGRIRDTLFAVVTANKAVVDNEGNIYLALTKKKSITSKTKASVAKYNSDFQKLWETELYNNPEFSAASLTIKTDASGNIYAGGKTEVASKDGKLDNSFIASLSNSGKLRWKKYTEISNLASSLFFDGSGNLMMMNKNCFIINTMNPADGTETGRIQMLSVCISKNTDALGSDFGINYENNILIAGSLGGSFYLALKSIR